MTNDADDGDDGGDDNDNDDYDNDDDDYGDDDDDNDDDEEHGDVGQIAKPIVCTRAALPPVNLSITALQMMDRPLQNTKETKIQLRTGRCRKESKVYFFYVHRKFSNFSLQRQRTLTDK